MGLQCLWSYISLIIYTWPKAWMQSVPIPLTFVSLTLIRPYSLFKLWISQFIDASFHNPLTIDAIKNWCMNLRFVCSLYYNQPIFILLPVNSVPTWSKFNSTLTRRYFNKKMTLKLFLFFFGFFINVVLRLQETYRRSGFYRQFVWTFLILLKAMN